MSKINEWDSDSIINCTFALLNNSDIGNKILEEHSFVHRVMGNFGGAKKFLVDKLGKQDYTVNLTNRNWVWERKTSGKKWRAYASIRGFSFELEQDISAEELIEVWEDFKQSIT